MVWVNHVRSVLQKVDYLKKWQEDGCLNIVWKIPKNLVLNNQESNLAPCLNGQLKKFDSPQLHQRINISAHWKCWETRRYFTCLLISHYIFVAWYKHFIWLVITSKMAVTFSKNPVGISSLYFQIFWCTVTVCWASSNANESSSAAAAAFILYPHSNWRNCFG